MLVMRTLTSEDGLINVMCKFLFGASFLALVAAAPAFAADMAAPLGVAEAPLHFSWTGCFIGGHVGGAASDVTMTNATGASSTVNSAGFVGGGQIGCDYQFASRWVLGVEGRAAWTSLDNSHGATVRNFATGAVIPSEFAVSNNFLASTTARLGYSFADRALLFVRGGGAWTHEKVDDPFIDVAGTAVDPTATATRTGWTIGTGADWAFAPHWSVNIEYNYYDFGTHSAKLIDAPTGVNVTIFSLKDTIQTVTAGVNYHF